MADGHHKRHNTVGGVALGTIISVVFVALAAVPAFLLLSLLADVKAKEEQVARNRIHIAVWDSEISARNADIEDLQHFVPSHGHPAPNPPSANPTQPPPPHN